MKGYVFTARELLAARREVEGENMEDEDNDVRFDHPDSRGFRRFPLGACWLCRRPFSDSSDEEQTGDMLGSLGIFSTRNNALFEKCKSSLLGAAKGNAF